MSTFYMQFILLFEDMTTKWNTTNCINNNNKIPKNKRNTKKNFYYAEMKSEMIDAIEYFQKKNALTRTRRVLERRNHLIFFYCSLSKTSKTKRWRKWMSSKIRMMSAIWYIQCYSFLLFPHSSCFFFAQSSHSSFVFLNFNLRWFHHYCRFCCLWQHFQNWC